MTEKKSKTLIKFAFIGLLIFNFSFLSAQIKYKKIETDKFSIELPATWTNDVNYMFFQLMSLAPGDTCCGDFREFITVSSDGQPKKNVDDFYQTEKKYIKEGAKDMHKLKVIDEGIMDLNGMKTNYLTYAFNYKGYFWYGRDYYTGIDLDENTFKEFNLVEKDYFFYHNNKGYMLRCTAKDSNFKTFEPLFDTVAKSFRFK